MASTPPRYPSGSQNNPAPNPFHMSQFPHNMQYGLSPSYSNAYPFQLPALIPNSQTSPQANSQPTSTTTSPSTNAIANAAHSPRENEEESNSRPHSPAHTTTQTPPQPPPLPGFLHDFPWFASLPPPVPLQSSYRTHCSITIANIAITLPHIFTRSSCWWKFDPSSYNFAHASPIQFYDGPL
eukprot:TRINITY_DN4376_c0_g1_i1.p1 TRINITY_DN4376_c0_g1~~TRINITY_DN4376_c0_g1_i1.p1  ORF type:complete len:182 (-),score=47.98 TRINITY_DN4376_c0_g1_i1:313-858(-)